MKIGFYNNVQFLLLENLQDAKTFCKLDSDIKTKQVINFWRNFNNQIGIKRDPLNYLFHELEGNVAILPLMATYLNYSEVDISYIDYLIKADEIISNFHNTIYAHIDKGEIFRINNAICGCPGVNDFDNCEDINNSQMINYILNGDFKIDFKIDKKIILIENASTYIPQKLIDKYCSLTSINSKDIQIINNFKYKTILFNDNDYIKLFSDGIKKGLNTFIFETTGQDESNIKKLILLIEHLASINNNINFNFYISTDKKEIFVSKLTNIFINFI